MSTWTMFHIQSIYSHDTICETEEIPSLNIETFFYKNCNVYLAGGGVGGRSSQSERCAPHRSSHLFIPGGMVGGPRLIIQASLPLIEMWSAQMHTAWVNTLIGIEASNGRWNSCPPTLSNNDYEKLRVSSYVLNKQRKRKGSKLNREQLI